MGRGVAHSWKLRLRLRPRPGVRAQLRAEEEKVAAREQEQRELEESLDVVRTELSRTEQARKDASIKVRSPAPHRRLHFLLLTKCSLAFICISITFVLVS